MDGLVLALDTIIAGVTAIVHFIVTLGGLIGPLS